MYKSAFLSFFYRFQNNTGNWEIIETQFVSDLTPKLLFHVAKSCIDIEFVN